MNTKFKTLIGIGFVSLLTLGLVVVIFDINPPSEKVAHAQGALGVAGHYTNSAGKYSEPVPINTIVDGDVNLLIYTFEIRGTGYPVSVTRDGQTFTLEKWKTTGDTKAGMYYLKNPNPGTSPVWVDLNAMTTMVSGVTAINNGYVGAGSPFSNSVVTGGSSGTYHQITVNSAPGEIVLEATSHWRTTAYPSRGAGQVQLHMLSGGGNHGGTSSYKAGASPSVTTSWGGYGNSTAWTAVSGSLKPGGPPPPPPPPPADPSPIAFWPMNETSGNIVPDESGNGNDGATGNMSTGNWVTGKYGNALIFDGVNEYVNVPDAPFDLQAPFSIAAWIYPETVGKARIFTHGDRNSAPWIEYNIDIKDTGKIVFEIQTGGVVTKLESPSNYPLNTWTHVVGTWDGITMRLYINGNPVYVAKSGTIDEMGAHTSIGKSWDIPDLFFDGKLDEVRVYNYALTDDLVIEVMNTDSSIPPPPPPPADNTETIPVGSVVLGKDGVFKSSSDDQRIIFVSQVPFAFSSNTGQDVFTSADVTSGVAVGFEAAIISQGDITFVANDSGEDTSIVAEGPLVSRNEVTQEGLIDILRNRGIANSYPAVIIKYNPIYLTALGNLEIPRLSQVDISWVLE